MKGISVDQNRTLRGNVLVRISVEVDKACINVIGARRPALVREENAGLVVWHSICESILIRIEVKIRRREPVHRGEGGACIRNSPLVTVLLYNAVVKHVVLHVVEVCWGRRALVQFGRLCPLSLGVDDPADYHGKNEENHNHKESKHRARHATII